MEDLVVFLILLGTGFVAGSIAESRHYSSIKKRESALTGLPAVTIEDPGINETEIEKVYLVMGECVVALDYFKLIAAGLKNIFGGRITSYETLLDRGRREAVLRMKERAAKAGCAIIINMRLETSSIGQNAGQKGGTGSVEVFAYGTGIVFKK